MAPRVLRFGALQDGPEKAAIVPSERSHRTVYLSAFAALLYIVVLGMVTSYSSPATVDMQKPGSRFRTITPDQITWIASLPPLTGALGNALSGYMTHRLGRKAVLMYASASYTAGWLVIVYAPTLALVYAGRLLCGFSAGITSVAVPAYLVEISTVEIRGLLTAGFQVAFSVGVFLIIAVGIALRWSWLAFFGAVTTVVAACFMCFVPESPAWLFKASKSLEALKGLEFLRGNRRDATLELKEMVDHAADEESGGMSLRELKDPALYKPALIAVALMLFQQFSGINALMSYSVDVFQKAKSSTDPSVAAAVVALVQVLATGVSSLLVDRVGRRILYVVSGILMTLCLLVLGLYSHFSQEPDSAWVVVHWNWVPLVSFMVYIAAFSLGFGTIPLVVVPEMVPIRSRSFLIAAANTSSSFFGFVVTKTFENTRGALGMAGVYWLYGAFTLLGFLFYWIFIPETKGRTIREIHRSFTAPKAA